jgi:hypothetical protein
MKIESKNLGLGGSTLNKMAREGVRLDYVPGGKGGKLSNGEVLVILGLRHRAGWPIKKIHEVFNTVSRGSIGMIVSRHSRRNVLYTSRMKLPKQYYDLIGEGTDE